jgi:hypothetical protein
LRISPEIDAEQERQHAVVNHVAHQLAELGVGTHRDHELVERDRIEVQVGAQLVELQRLVVDDRGAGIETERVLARRLRVHGDEKVDLLLAPDPAVPGRADREPRGESLDVGRKQVFS